MSQKESIKVNKNFDLSKQGSFKSYGLYEAATKVLNIIFSLIVLIVGMPLWVIIALMIFIDDPKGSPFYIQERVKKNGEHFKMVKFRSMRIGAEEELDKLQDYNEADGPVFKIKDDPRITKIGRFIRKYSIDEMPQFINVLLGDMRIVGPRPPLPKEVEHYNEYQMQRLSIEPGITCYWQIQLERHKIKFDDWVALDLKYIKQRRLRVDILIMLKTIFAIFSGYGD